MIRRDERLFRVLERDPSLLEVLVDAAPELERLRRRGIGRIVGRVITVERAARMAGLEPEELVRRLERGGVQASGAGGREAPGRAATDGEHERGAAAPAQRRGGTMATRAAETTIPATLAAIPPELIVDADVRATLRAGGEPFAEIMAARRRLRPGGVLRVRAIFEPAPLYFVLGAQGLDHWTEKLAEDDWRIWFFASSGVGGADGVDAAAESAREGAAAEPVGESLVSADDGNVVVLDVRGLEPPEPMLQTLAALDDLPAGATLVQINVRVPRFLLPMLEDRGFSYEIREQGPTLVRTFIRRHR